MLELNSTLPVSARMVELVDTRDLKSRGLGRVRAGSSPAPGTKCFRAEAVRMWRPSVTLKDPMR